jgi:hypothetical protein
MIAALALALEYDHRGERRNLESRPRTGDAPTNDENVGRIGRVGAQNARARTGIRRFMIRESRVGGA